MTIQPTDLFLVSNGGSKKCEAQNLSSKTGNVLVNRGGSSFRTTIAEIPTKVLDDDLMLVNRGGVSFKATGTEVKQLFDPAPAPPAIGDYLPDEGGYWGGIINGQKIIIPTKYGSETMQKWRTQGGSTQETGTDIRDDGRIFTNNYKNSTVYPAAYWHGSNFGVNVNAVGGKTDWYLPALLEIQQIQLYFNPLTTPYAAFKAGAAEAYLYGPHPYYPSNNTYYWTSSNDYNNPRVVGIRMDTGRISQVPCDEAEWTPFVRPIRRGTAVLKSEEGAVEEANRLVRISTAKAVAKAAAKAVVEAVEAKKESQLNNEKESTEGS